MTDRSDKKDRRASVVALTKLMKNRYYAAAYE
jgi:hypothetical protein